MDVESERVRIIGIAGTPGTGKSSVAEALARKLGWKVVSVNDLAEEAGAIIGYDEERGCHVVDVEKLRRHGKEKKLENVIVEGHLAHYLDVDVLVVLRCKPTVLEERLKKKRWSPEKIRENVEAEILDIITQEAYNLRGWKRAYEIDTTNKNPEEVAEIVFRLIEGKREEGDYELGSVSWEEEFEALTLAQSHRVDEVGNKK